MNRKAVICLLTAALLFTVPFVEAQKPAKIPRIGYLEGGSPATSLSVLEAFRQGLRELGYVEGQNIVIEDRWGEGRNDRLPELAAELVRLKVDVIVTRGDVATLAAKQATSAIPIVMATVGNPLGFVASLARPGGNITGLSNLAVDISGKWLELLKEAAPRITRAAVLWNPANPTHAVFWEETQIAAQALGVSLVRLDFRSPDDFDSAFTAMTKERVGALVVFPDPMIHADRKRIADKLIKTRVPAIANQREFAEAGGLMSYGATALSNARRAATYVDKILKGRKPADLPVEQPMRFELVINLKTANQIGLTIPPWLLMRADKVIK